MFAADTVLDCINQRDGGAMANLFHASTLWSTASPFGDIHGHENIKTLMNSKLPHASMGRNLSDIT
ncbi:MAG: hypothetical protein OEZ38_11415 [Gammaproteobacteria bacterium]|nr:hypothetical protein [Gammaproteobacteria bacterium]